MNIWRCESCVQSGRSHNRTKVQCVFNSKKCLVIFNCNKNEFFRIYVTMDVTRLHHYPPERNRQSAEWTTCDEPNSKRGKIASVQSTGKKITSVFLEAQGTIFTDNLEKCQIINSNCVNYYTALLERLKAEITKNGFI